ncbi:MAG: gliding motility-associated C-terminal domain-containing protein [Saprospiraceae bacterium]|nr:gliding motility-associated C-terminal domain-containing protein [Saprospiraceae bacterium]MCB9320110.1 gliding motility-associated C-terminal domain-containing protein [Lewinellaceae bacterium]
MKKTLTCWRWIIYAGLLCSWWTIAAQLPDPLSLNTAANGTGGRFAQGANDAYWYAADGDTMHSITAFVPARVVGQCDPAWHTSPYPNNDWIAYDYGNGCYHAAEGCVDVFYQRIINLPETNPCGLPISDHYAVAMDFYADNCIYEVRVNGATNYRYTGTTDPYKFPGHDTAITVVLNKGWHAGNNYLIVQIKSCPTAEGFLAQANLTAIEPEYFPVTVRKNICTGEQFAGHSTSGMYLDTITSAQGCDSIRMLELQVNNSYQILESRTICKGEVYDFHGMRLSKTGQYSLTMPTQYGCDSTITLDLEVTGDQSLGNDTLICAASDYLIHSPYSQTHWNDGDFSPTKRITKSGTYWAIMTDPGGCTFSDTVTVTFASQTSVPNVFSPNDDGMNDCLRPFFSGSEVSAYQFNIYDRSGSLVFRSSNPMDCWDGSVNGVQASSGVYLYTLELNTEYCGKGTLRGDITLIR